MIKSKQIQRPQLVLVVDDQEINRDALGVILEDDYEVIYAENGKEALKLMREHMNDLSIVLLDLMMPVMSGFDVLETVREDDQLKRIPIIVLTAEKKAELQALQMGAADFITKPFDMHEVIFSPGQPDHRAQRGPAAHFRRRARSAHHALQPQFLL